MRHLSATLRCININQVIKKGFARAWLVAHQEKEKIEEDRGRTTAEACIEIVAEKNCEESFSNTFLYHIYVM